MAMSSITVRDLGTCQSPRIACGLSLTDERHPARARDGADNALSKYRMWIDDDDADGLAPYWPLRPCSEAQRAHVLVGSNVQDISKGSSHASGGAVANPYDLQPTRSRTSAAAVLMAGTSV